MKKNSRPHLNTDVLIVGAGIMGLTIARELCGRRPELKVTLIEKESSTAAHASGRNSSVLHAGFYYLNAVSPAFTCSFSFSKFIVDEIEKRGIP